VSEEEARRLGAERAERRAAGDYGAADALRERIEAIGFRVTDTPEGFALAPMEPAVPPEPPRLRPQDVSSVLDDPPDVDVTIHWLAEGWPEDVQRGIASFDAHRGSRRVQHVVVEAVPAPGGWPEGCEVLAMREGLGWARCRNAGLARSRGALVLVVDGSTEATGDVFGPLEAALADPSVGIAGPVGAVTDEHLHEFVPAEAPECDAIEGYLMAVRREVLERGVRFDDRFRFYRSADLDFSFAVKDLGLRALMVEVPIERHEHRTWWSTEPQERAKLSKRNYYRFLDRWRGRSDLTVSGRGSSG
jgi:cysteinyl-tRNA synthetase